MTLMKMFGDFQKGQYQEKNLRFGVREHGMGAICNGIFVHNDGMIPYCATFFNFADYMRAAIRMSALSQVCLPLVCCTLVSKLQVLMQQICKSMKEKPKVRSLSTRSNLLRVPDPRECEK